MSPAIEASAQAEVRGPIQARGRLVKRVSPAWPALNFLRLARLLFSVSPGILDLRLRIVGLGNLKSKISNHKSAMRPDEVQGRNSCAALPDAAFQESQSRDDFNPPVVPGFLRARTPAPRSVPPSLAGAVFAFFILALGLFALGGCASRRSEGSAGGRPVERLDLFLLPLALDLDGRPGPDALGARVYAGSRRSAIGAPLTSGRLEMLLFDGVVRADELGQATPLRVWSYEGGKLAAYAQKTSIGTGYRFILSWGEQAPRKERITLVARYTAPDGFVVTSAPGSIPLVVK